MTDHVKALVALVGDVNRFAVDAAVEGSSLDVLGYDDGLADGWQSFLE